MEMQAFGVDVGVAYFLFLDTDMVATASASHRPSNGSS
jgi:hypothetical protein